MTEAQPDMSLAGRDPEREVPEFNAVQQMPGISFDRAPAEPYEVYFQAESDVLTIGIGERAPIGFVAYDSDKITATQALPGMLHFHPAGSRIFYRTETNYADLTIMNLDPNIRKTLEAGYGRTLHGIETRINIPSTLAMGLGQSVAAFVKTGGPRMVAESLANLAVAEAMRAFADPEKFEAAFRPNVNRRAIERAKEYIEANLESNLGLNGVATAAAMSPYHFSRSFKAAEGQTMSRYIMSRRVERARHMLLSTDLSIAEVAFACGFSSQSHMTTVFSQMLGVTPGRLRGG